MNSPVVVRSGVSSLLLWMGLAIIAVGVLVGGGGAITGLVIGDPSMVWMLVLVAVFGVAGGLMHAAGRRCRVEIGVDQVRWFPILGASVTVPWQDVSRVEVPQDPLDGRKVRLALRDGRRIDVSSVRMSSGDGGSWADAGYLDAGRQLVTAHQNWLRTRQLR